MTENLKNSPVTFLVIGAGDRGITYSRYSKTHQNEMKVIGAAEPNDKRRKLFSDKFSL
ncbi:MAG: hypothetical protein ABSF32_05650 [Ignavibacteria bacterium]|jgi:hypothetical protein